MPRISIIIPVYNVEKYLRQCLDSVVNQTLRDIQIICVDHSSKDDSRAILDEYAAGDSRIEIVHCDNTNGGPGQARNAAWPHIQGKYTYFVDSDDWLDLNLCEKAFERLEDTNADVVFFYWNEIADSNEKIRKTNNKNNHLETMPHSGVPASEYLNIQTFAPWNRIIKTTFLNQYKIRFPEGQLPEDCFYHWAVLVNDPKVEVIPEKLYVYRLRENSQMGLRGEYVANTVLVCSLIQNYLKSQGKYEIYRNKIAKDKIHFGYHVYHSVYFRYRDLVKKVILENLPEDDIAFLHEKRVVPNHIRDFYLALLGDPYAKMRNIFFHPVNKLIRCFFIIPLEKLLRQSKKIIRAFQKQNH